MRAVLIVLLLGLAGTAAAEPLRVGLYAPAAPFAGTSARLDYVTRLADHLAAAVGEQGTGKVYARASDFAAAVKNGDLDAAVVDAAYLATSGASYTVVAIATCGGDQHGAWQLVTRGGEQTLLELKGKKLLLPSTGGRESDLVHHALLGGELAKGFFAAIETSPDTVSALAALGLARADAAIVPAGVDLPSGVTRVATLADVPWPALVVFRGSADRKKKLGAAAATFEGGDVLGGFTAGGADTIQAFARRFARPERRGPMVIPNLRLAVDALVEARAPRVRRVDLTRLLAPPPALPPP